jgi:beta-carotene hydroxylase
MRIDGLRAFDTMSRMHHASNSHEREDTFAQVETAAASASSALQRGKFLRHAADRRTLFWAFVLMPGLSAAQFLEPRLAGWLLPLGLYAGFCAGVLTHNQNHRVLFRQRTLNELYGCWLSIFYGHPIFAWHPTHNRNHHRFTNRPGDASLTSQRSSENTAWVAFMYFFDAARSQGPLTRAYVERAKAQSPRTYRWLRAQLVCLVGAHVALLASAVWVYGSARGAFVYASAMGIPALFSLWSMMFINFIQHVHCDAWSKYDHSRNFVSPLGNFLVFNAGLHTAHHARPALHWSELPKAHAALAPFIDSELKQASIFGFCFRTYVLGAVSPRFRTRPLGALG